MVNKKAWNLAFLLSGFILCLTAFYLTCWGIKLIWILNRLEANAHVFTGFTPLIWHIEELGYKIERAGAIFWMALGGAIIQFINGLWRWISRD